MVCFILPPFCREMMTFILLVLCLPLAMKLRRIGQRCSVVSSKLFPSSLKPKKPIVFVSDRNKGLKPALREVFLDICETSCAYHIQANVKQKFGDACSTHVMAMAKSYSLRYFNQVLDTI
jgi:hypothetical protein